MTPLVLDKGCRKKEKYLQVNVSTSSHTYYEKAKVVG